ncbi:MAG: ribosome maturation factor RimM [Acidobacteriota bacterium]
MTSSEPEPAWEQMVLVGFVARTHGRRGEVIVNPETDFAPARFRPGATLFARVASGPVERVTLTSARFQQGRPIVGITGIGSINEAERMAGAELRIAASQQQKLPDGQYYHHELIGCEMVTTDGQALGTVTSVEGSGAASRLVVRGPRAELLVPLVDEFCRIDVTARRIVVSLPDGLLEVNGD